MSRELIFQYKMAEVERPDDFRSYREPKILLLTKNAIPENGCDFDFVVEIGDELKRLASGTLTSVEFKSPCRIFRTSMDKFELHGFITLFQGREDFEEEKEPLKFQFLSEEYKEQFLERYENLKESGFLPPMEDPHGYGGKEAAADAGSGKKSGEGEGSNAGKP